MGFEITNDIEHFERFSNISQFLKSKGIKDSDTKIGRELKKLGLEKEYKKMSGSSVMIYKGIRRIRDDSNDVNN